MKYSIVMSYHNRKPQLLNALKSIEFTSVPHEDIEFVIVDDGSIEEHRVEDIGELFPQFSFDVVRIEPEEKTWTNPCIPFNRGFKRAKGDVVVIQNPECIHFGDVMSHIAANTEDNVYLSYACYSIDKEKTKQLITMDRLSMDPRQLLETVQSTVNPIVKQVIRMNGGPGWYNHSRYRPVFFHFLSAIKREDLYDLRGFDERYAAGIAYDDDELVVRIRRKGMELKLVDNPITLHQWHYSPEGFTSLVSSNTHHRQLEARNLELLTKVTKLETGWRANGDGWLETQ